MHRSSCVILVVVVMILGNDDCGQNGIHTVTAISSSSSSTTTQPSISTTILEELMDTTTTSSSEKNDGILFTTATTNRNTEPSSHLDEPPPSLLLLELLQQLPPPPIVGQPLPLLGATTTTGSSTTGSTTTGSSSSPISTRLSTQCWRTGIEIIQQATASSSSSSSSSEFQNSGHTDNPTNQNPPFINAVAFCSNLTELQLKRLVLEITYCHMHDVDKAMFQSTAIQNLCTASSSTPSTSKPFIFMDLDTIQMCLHHLTDIGYHTYTYFLPHVELVCLRKTQELFHQYQYDAMNTVTNNYIRMTQQSKEQLRTNQEQVEHLWNVVTNIQEQLSNELQDQFHNTQVEFDQLFDNQVQVWTTHMSEVLERIYVRDNEHQQHMDDWMQYQSSRLLQQSREMEYQQQVLYQHEVVVRQLSVTIQETAQVVQPILQLQSILTMAQYSYHWISFVLHFVGTFNILWIVTRFPWCHSVRRYLFAIVWTEAILEIFLAVAMEYDIVLWHDTNDYTTYVTEIRQWAIIVEVAVYVFGMIMSLFRHFIVFPTQAQKRRRQRQPEWMEEGYSTLDDMTQQQQQQQTELQHFLLSQQTKFTSFPPPVARNMIPKADVVSNSGRCVYPKSQQRTIDTMNQPIPSGQQLHHNESNMNHPDHWKKDCTGIPDRFNITKPLILPNPNSVSPGNAVHAVLADHTTAAIHSVPSIHTVQTPRPVRMSSICPVEPIHIDVRQPLDSNIIMHSVECTVTENEKILPNDDPDTMILEQLSSRKRPATDQSVDSNEDDYEEPYHYPKRMMVCLEEQESLK